MYGTVEGVRSESGNLIPIDFPNEDINKKLKAAYSKIQVALHLGAGQPLLDGTNVEYDLAVEIAERYAAAFCLKKLGSQFESSVKELEDEADADLKLMTENIQESPAGDVEEETAIERTPFYSWNKNPMIVNQNSSPDEIEPVPRVNPYGVPVPRGRLDHSLQIGL